MEIKFKNRLFKLTNNVIEWFINDCTCFTTKEGKDIPLQYSFDLWELLAFVISLLTFLICDIVLLPFMLLAGTTVTIVRKEKVWVSADKCKVEENGKIGKIG